MSTSILVNQATVLETESDSFATLIKKDSSGTQLHSETGQAIIEACDLAREKERKMQERIIDRRRLITRSQFPRIRPGASYNEIKGIFASVVYALGWRLNVLLEAVSYPIYIIYFCLLMYVLRTSLKT